MKLDIDYLALPIAPIPGTLPSWPTIEPNDVTNDVDYRKRIIEAVLEFRARQTPTTTKENHEKPMDT